MTRPVPHWFCILAAEARRVCRERGVSYDDATAVEIAPVHAEAERRLGEELWRLVERQLRQ